MQHNYKIRKNDIFFFIAYALYLIAQILSTSFFYKYIMGDVFNVSLTVCILLLILQECIRNKIDGKSLFILALGVGLVILSYTAMPGILQNRIFHLILFIYVGRKVDFDKIAKVSCIITFFLLFIIVTCSKIGIIENYTYIFSDDRISRTRQYLGFRYTLFGPALLFNATAIYIYIKNKSIKWRDVLLCAALNIYMYMQTYSRLSFYFSIILIVIAIATKWELHILSRNNICTVAFRRVAVFSYVLAAIISYYFVAFYNPGITWMKDLNLILENRLFFGQLSILKYGVSLTGQNIKWVGNGLDAFGERYVGSYLYVDNFYLQILQNYGLLFAFLIILFFTYALYKCLKKKQYYLFCIFVLIALHGIIDDLILSLHYNTFWLAILPLLFNKEKN